jgi:hypothetical protein
MWFDVPAVKSRTMINFTPPIKASLFISFLYIICFQLFVQSGSYVWLYPANILFFVCSVLYILSLNRTTNSKLNLLVLTGKGIKLSFISSLLSIAGAAVIFMVNYFLLPEAKSAHLAFKSIKDSMALVFANAFMVNIVFGSLGAFLTAGLMNEKNYQGVSKPLPSVKS